MVDMLRHRAHTEKMLETVGTKLSKKRREHVQAMLDANAHKPANQKGFVFFEATSEQYDAWRALHSKHLKMISTPYTGGGFDDVLNLK